VFIDLKAIVRLVDCGAYPPSGKKETANVFSKEGILKYLLYKLSISN